MNESLRKKIFKLPKSAEKIKKGELTVGFIGDSVSCGGLAAFGDWAIDPWPTYLMNDMQKEYPETRFVWENVSVSGRKTAWGVDTIEERLLDKGYTDLIFIALGANDRWDFGDNPAAGKYAPAMTEEETRQSYVFMIDKIHNKNPDAEIIFVKYGRDFEIRGIQGLEGGDISGYMTAMSQISDEYRIPLIDTMSRLYDECVKYAGVEKAMDEGWKHYVTDEIHVNDRGQKLYGDIVWEQVKEALNCK